MQKGCYKMCFKREGRTIPQRWKNKGKIQFFSQVLTVKKDTFAGFDFLIRAPGIFAINTAWKITFSHWKPTIATV